MSTFHVGDNVFRIDVQPPPGTIVAPDGFPADPRPRDAPKVFLDAMDVRIKVFCDEQKCSLMEELDVDDPKSWSWVVYQSETGQTESGIPVSTIRMVPPPHPAHPNGFENPDEVPYIKLTRVATLPSARGKGLSKILIEHALQYCSKHGAVVAGAGWTGLVLTHAQVDVEGMYKKLGFATDERLGQWEEERILHVGMWRTL